MRADRLAKASTRLRLLPGARAGVPAAIAASLLGLSFGVLARPVMGSVAAIVMSAIVFAASAQFGATAVLAAGGGALPAILAGTLLNARFLPMGIAVAPSLVGGSLKRAAQGLAVADASWALANRGDGRFDRDVLVGATLLGQYPAWLFGTVIGVLAGDLVDPKALGLDAIFPAFFLALLVDELRRRIRAVAALGGAAIAIALVPAAPAGVAVLAASMVAALGLLPSRKRIETWGGSEEAER